MLQLCCGQLMSRRRLRRSRAGPWQRATLELVFDLDAAASEAAVAARFQRYAEQAGFASVACLVLPRAGALTGDCVLMNTRPKLWSAEYLRRHLADSDPVLREAMRRDRAFAWSDIWRQRALTPRESAVMSYSAEFGLHDGLVVPIFDVGGIGLVSFAAGELQQLEVTQRQALTLAAVYLHNRLSALRRKRAPAMVPLTEREREVMRWTAAGKSDWQIGRILSISAKTVNFHVENVKRKFGVSSRAQAIVSTILQGSIRP
jgi:LuxR family quorum sensing-dependent transcriptional regulator